MTPPNYPLTPLSCKFIVSSSLRLFAVALFSLVVSVTGASAQVTLNGEEGPLTFTAGDPPLVLQPTVTLTSQEPMPIQLAVIRINEGFQDGDILAVEGSINSQITISYNSEAGFLLLGNFFGTRIAIEEWELALRSVTYHNTLSNLDLTPRTISFLISTGGAMPISDSLDTVVNISLTNSAPTISGTPDATVAEDSPCSFTPGGGDIDVGDALTYTISGNPSWLSINPATGELSGTPTNADVGPTTGIIITVADDATPAPTISGTPNATVAEDSPYSFTPGGGDIDVGDALTYTISGNPSWLSINPATGELSGTPTNADVGPTTGIIITVADDATPAPTISGTPNATVAEDSPYSFTPGGGDIDVGDALTYTISGNPSWLSINPATGELSGTPTNADVGPTTGIMLSVADDATPALTATLEFDLTVTNVNDAPTADAGDDQTVDEGEEVTLEGSGSSDPNNIHGDTLGYLWEQISGDTAELTAATTATASFTAPVRQTENPDLVFQLTVTDGDGETSTDRVTITVTSDVTIQKTVESINRFLHTRTNLILANQPKLSRRINRLQRGVGSEQLSFATGEITKLKPFEFNFLSLGSGNYKFATSLDQVTRAADHLQMMQGDVGGLAATGMTATHERRRFDVWFEASFNKFNGSAGSSGEFAIAYLGADYLVSPDLLIGGLLQYDRLTSSAASENIEGTGWMAGPYVTARLQDNLYS